jgi:hypothetical protein
MSSYNPTTRTKRLRKRQYEKVAVKDVGIDHQILCLHIAMADKCLDNPKLFEQVSERIEIRYAANQMKYGAYITWVSILELKDKPEEFKQALFEKSVKMRSMRRATVFTQVLSEEERMQVIESLNDE